jgi:hypothetical protein
MRRTFIGLVVGLVLGTALIVGAQTVGVGRFTLLRIGVTTQDTRIRAGTGTPEAVVTGNVADLFLRTDGGAGTSFYVKESGAGNTGWAASVSAMTASSVNTFTNKTYDAEGTGNVFTLPEKLWIPAGICNNVTATATLWSFPTTNPAVSSCNTGTNTQKATLDFADGANSLSAQTNLMLPSDWISTGGFGVSLKWFASTATSGAVVWQVATICVADAETSDPAFNTASTVTDTAKGTINQDNDASISAVTVTGCLAGELLYLKVFRDPTNASDTMADTAKLRGIAITYRRAI